MEEKIREYFLSEEFQSFVNQLDALIGIDPNNPENYEKDGAVFYFLTHWFEERMNDMQAKELAQKVLEFLSEEEINRVIDFINQNFSAKREEIWKETEVLVSEKPEETTPMEKEESFEEKERRYLAMMQDILGLRKSVPEKMKPEEASKEREIQERVESFKSKFSSEDDNEQFLDLSKMR